jgi:TNF receptor-associated protein 1
MLSKSIKKTLSILNNSVKSKLGQFGKAKPFMTMQARGFSTEQTINIDEPELVQSNKENLGFKAETKKLLDIVTHSLYTDKEIFLRELLSNASDALEKQRFLELTGKLSMLGEPLYISISTNEKNKTITIFDSGVGMTREEMIDNLGTIAKSGTQNFLKSVKDSQKEGASTESLIGQFGVGFYSSFIVGDTVEVISKPQESAKAYHWVSDGNGEFQISDVENVDFKRGTKVIIHLKSECRDFCRPTELQKIIKKYSNFISYTIKLNGEVINNLQAIWYREKKDVTADEYQKFYELLANTKMNYKYLLHFSSDVPLDIKALLYIPSSSMEKYGVQEENTGLSLYSKKILIKQKCTELLPSYLRFVKGVVDCSDIPLSISRESYQDSNLIFKLRVLITKRILKKLEDEMKADPETYDKWYDEYQQNIREGVFSDHDNAETLLKLLRFRSTFSNNRVNLDEYISKMKPGQDKIYYCIIGMESDINTHVFLESYKGSDLPILISQNPLDEVLIKNKGQFKNFKFLNIENESDDFIDKFRQEQSSSVSKIPDEDISAYTLWIKNELEPFVTKVSVSKRLKDTPLLITSNISAHMKTMMAMMNPDNKDPYAQFRDFIVEINPSSEVIINLNTMRKEDPKVASLVVKTLYDTALLQSNIPIQNKEFTKRTFQIMKMFMNERLTHKSGQAEKPEIERLQKE